ncbi:hypothetical protein BDZ89DRAFT_1114588 [Hymenopellis radicata]|nr:hypothetical protein BDZ89DRAFT_1114588 [Hymenopellis radicata]
MVRQQSESGFWSTKSHSGNPRAARYPSRIVLRRVVPFRAGNYTATRLSRKQVQAWFCQQRKNWKTIHLSTPSPCHCPMRNSRR